LIYPDPLVMKTGGFFSSHIVSNNIEVYFY